MKATPHRFRSCLIRYLRQEDGATAIEFALLSPIFLMVLFAVLEFAIAMHISGLLEDVAQEAARMGKVKGQNGAATISALVNQRMGAWVKPGQVVITPEVLGTMDDYDATGAPQSAGYGGSNNLVAYTLTYTWKPITPIPYLFAGANHVYSLQAHVLVKNEEF